MELTDILSVSGMKGLFRVVSQRSDGFIVRSLDGSDTKFAPTRKHGFSPLETIAIYTHSDTVELKEVLLKMKKSEITVPDSEVDNDQLKSYFSSIIPDYDPERVRISDIKKVVRWYSILNDQNILTTKDQKEEE